MLLILRLGLLAASIAFLPVEPAPGQEPPLRASLPIEAIAADLENFVPQYMQDQRIPGVSIVLIRDGRIAWRKAFGVSNTITRDPVTPDTVFEVASNSKVVAAYIAMHLVDQGKLSLDKPLNSYLANPWLPSSPYRDQITLRQVLSHSSGLGHSTTNRENRFAPGLGYSYSAVGYLYLQAVIEEVTSQPLEALARQTIFAPLGMSSSSFINRPDLTSRTSNGHMHPLVPTVAIIAVFIVSSLFLTVVGIPLHRIWTGRWRPGKRKLEAAAAAALIFAVAALTCLLWWAELPQFAALIVWWGLMIVGAFSLAFYAVAYIASRLSPEKAGCRIVIQSALAAFAAAGILFLAGSISNFPVPRWPQVPSNAAGSMRASAFDLATFLIELSRPHHLSVETARLIHSPQVRLSDELSWGLGPGIQNSPDGDALWQWGQHLHFQSVMVIYPARGFGVVVCTNNDLLNPDVAVKIAHRALGGRMEPILKATHLQYNYH